MNGWDCTDGTCKCRYCSEVKPCADFYPAPSPRGHSLRCRACTAQAVLARYAETHPGYTPRAQPAVVPCYWCGTPFTRTDARQRNCSYACGYASHKKPDASRVYLRNCTQCDRPFASRTGRGNFCSDTCRTTAKAYKRNERCPDCGEPREFLQTYCPPCRLRHLQAVRRVSKHQRRARQRGALSERIDPLLVYERDEWRCGICHKHVDRGLAWPDPMSASLDHVVPLAMNGSHTYLNTQLAHLRCNLDKRATPPRVRGKERPDQVLF